MKCKNCHCDSFLNEIEEVIPYWKERGAKYFHKRNPRIPHITLFCETDQRKVFETRKRGQETGFQVMVA